MHHAGAAYVTQEAVRNSYLLVGAACAARAEAVYSGQLSKMRWIFDRPLPVVCNRQVRTGQHAAPSREGGKASHTHAVHVSGRAAERHKL